MEKEIDYYSIDSMDGLKEKANLYFRNQQYRKAEEYYLRAKWIISQHDDVLKYLSSNYYPSILINEGRYQDLKKYYKWIVDSILNMESSVLEDRWDLIINCYKMLIALEKGDWNLEKAEEYSMKSYQLLIEHYDAIMNRIFSRYSYLVQNDYHNCIIEVFERAIKIIERRKGKESQEYIECAAYLDDYRNRYENEYK